MVVIKLNLSRSLSYYVGLSVLLGTTAHSNPTLTPWNIVTTIAGDLGRSTGFADGTGNAARFNKPYGLVLDSGGNYLYITEWGNHALRQLNLSNGYVTTVAGTGAPGHTNGTGTIAQFNFPSSIGRRADGTLLIADQSNHRIRLVDPSNSFQTSDYAGTGVPGSSTGPTTAATFTSPRGLAVAPDGMIYVAHSELVSQINPTTLQVTTFAGTGVVGFNDGPAASAQFDNPISVGVSPDNTKIYVGELGNDLVRLIKAGNVTAVFGLTTPIPYGLDNPAAFVVDTYGTMYFTDYGTSYLYQSQNNDSTGRIIGGYLDPGGVDTSFALGYADGTGASARFYNPAGMVQGSDGSLYIADVNNNVIRKMDANKIYINSSDAAAANYTDYTLTLDRDTTYTRLDSDADGHLALNGHNLTFGKNDGATDNSTFNGTLSGSGNLTVNAGAGKTLTLAGTATYSGDTTVSTGTLIGTLPSTTNLTVANGATYQLGTADQTIASLSGQGNVNTAGHLLTVIQNFTTTFQGIITGNGGIVKAGSGTLEFTGANNYTGLTVVQNGVVTADATTIPGPIQIQNSSTVNFNQAAPGTYAHDISGSATASLNKLGTDELILTGNNTGFLGTTTVSAGTLTGSSTSMPGTVVNNATINFAQTSNGTFTRNISGNISGVTQKTGNAALTLTGNNTGFLGTTTVSNGTLRGNVSSLLGTNIAVSGGANVIIDQPTSTFYGTTLSGAGTITKEGAGTLTLTGNLTHTGSLIVNNGRLNINGMTTTTTATVNNGGILGGTGTINGAVTVMSGGTAYAGNSIGQLNVGSFNLNAGGYINAEFTTQGTLPLDANLINVAGTATIDQGFVRLLPHIAGTYVAGNRYTIVRAANPLVINNGGIVGVIPAAGFRANVIVQYDLAAHEVQLLLLSTPLGYGSLVDPDTNEGRVAYDLEHTQAVPGSDLETIFTSLNPLSNADLINALSQMHVFRNHSLAIANHNLYRQAADLISMHSKPLPLCPRQPKFQTLQDLVPVPTSNHKSLLLPSEKKDISPNFINFDSPVVTASGQALPLWVAGFANLQRQRMQKEYLGYNSEAGAVLTGIHLPLQDNWGVGVTIGYGQTALEWSKDQGKVRTDHYIMGLSSYWTKQQYFLEGIVLGGFDRMDSKRYLRFSNIRRKAKGNINGIEGGMQLTAGMDMKANGLDMQPFASVSTFKSHYKRYTERGASSTNLTVKGQNSTYVFTRIGTVFSQKIVWEKGTWSPLFQVQYDFSTSMGRNKQWSKFADSATAFFTRGDTLNRHTFVVGGGVQVEMPAGLTVKMLYNFKVNSKAINHEAALKLNYCY